MKNYFFLLFFLSFSLGAQNLSKILENNPTNSINPPTSPQEVCCDQDNPTLLEQLKNNFFKLGGDPIALAQTLCFYNKYKNQTFKAEGDPSRQRGIRMDNSRYITINDLNKSSRTLRLFIIDMITGKVEVFISSHGIGGKEGVPESDLYAEGFSNLDSSHATPRGFFITGNRKNSSSDPRWNFSMRLHGLQEGINDKSFARAIIMHPFPDLPEDFETSDSPKPILDIWGAYALSHGCTMISERNANHIIDTIKAKDRHSGGSLYYNYTPIEKAKGVDYCGDEALLKK